MVWRVAGMSKLRKLREAAGLSQTKLAKLVEASLEQVCQLENGRRGKTIEWAKRLAPALRTAPTELLPPDLAAILRARDMRELTISQPGFVRLKIDADVPTAVAMQVLALLESR